MKSAACEGCPARSQCEVSRWKEYGGGDRISMVYACTSCREEVPGYHEFGYGTIHIAPECPRFRGAFASAIPCEECRKRRDHLAENRPGRQESLRASRDLMLSIFDGVVAEKAGTHSLANAQRKEQALKDFSRAGMMPYLQDPRGMQETWELVVRPFLETPGIQDRWRTLSEDQIADVLSQESATESLDPEAF